ncbi:MAG: sulfatase [Planctomycetaceae bacterium]|nr:sulfatase [Planctomycetaceae bacterium]
MNNPLRISRRQMLTSSACGIGSLALAGLCQEARADYDSPLAPKTPHFEPRAKRIIFLHMRGAPAHMDTFDYKPQLNELGGKVGKSKNRKLVASPWSWKQRGESGLWVSDLLPNIAKHADELCVLSGMHTDIGNHTPAMLHLHTGNFVFARPSMGAWILYGLGTENQNLPGFITMSPPVINGGAWNYGTAFLPAVYQGTAIGDIKTPIADAKVGNIKNPYLSPRQQRAQLDFAQSLNREFADRDQNDSQLEGVIESAELAFRMQADMPHAMDLSQETAGTLEMYGIGEGKKSDNFGRQCLLARRFAEAGVRYIELCDEFWDQHTKLKSGHGARAAATELPIAGLLADLKRRGMLEDTIVLWGGEFGRTPDSSKKDGRDHNINGFTMFLAGGGVKGGFKFGETDELGYAAVTDRIHTHDLHATLLHILGLDHTKLTSRYAGRDFRLTDVYGRVVDEVLA